MAITNNKISRHDIDDDAQLKFIRIAISSFSHFYLLQTNANSEIHHTFASISYTLIRQFFCFLSPALVAGVAVAVVVVVCCDRISFACATPYRVQLQTHIRRDTIICEYLFVL